jgi:hypothetical protein
LGNLKAWSMPPALLALVILEIGSCFLPRLAWISILLFYPSHTVEGTGHMAPHRAVVHWLGVLQMIFCLSWTGTAILLISASPVARVTGVSHWCQQKKLIFLRATRIKDNQTHREKKKCKQGPAGRNDDMTYWYFHKKITNSYAYRL